MIISCIKTLIRVHYRIKVGLILQYIFKPNTPLAINSKNSKNAFTWKHPSRTLDMSLGQYEHSICTWVRTKTATLPVNSGVAWLCVCDMNAIRPQSNPSAVIITLLNRFQRCHVARFSFAWHVIQRIPAIRRKSKFCLSNYRSEKVKSLWHLQVSVRDAPT